MVGLAATVPLVTVTALAGKVLTGSLKVKVKVTGPVTVVALVPLMTTAGAGLLTVAGGEDEEPLQPIITAGTTAATSNNEIHVSRMRLIVIRSPWECTAFEPDWVGFSGNPGTLSRRAT
jgi:hypothetical protein